MAFSNHLRFPPFYALSHPLSSKIYQHFATSEKRKISRFFLSKAFQESFGIRYLRHRKQKF